MVYQLIYIKNHKCVCYYFKTLKGVKYHMLKNNVVYYDLFNMITCEEVIL